MPGVLPMATGNGIDSGVRLARLAGTPSWLSSGMIGPARPPEVGAGAGVAGSGAVPGAPTIGETGIVCAGAPVMADAPVSAVAAVCISAAALAGLVAICWSMLSAGTPGTAGGMAGSAAAVGLSASAAEHSPAAAIALAANSFVKRDMVIPIPRWQV